MPKQPTPRGEMKQKVFEELGWIWASERGEDSMAIQKEIEGFIAQVEAKAREEERTWWIDNIRLANGEGKHAEHKLVDKIVEERKALQKEDV